MRDYALIKYLAVLIFVGCGPRTQTRYPIALEITYENAPCLGLVSVIPAEATMSRFAFSTDLNQGKYSQPADQGLAAGTYTIKIELYDPVEHAKLPQEVDENNPVTIPLIGTYSSEIKVDAEHVKFKYDLKQTDLSK